MEQREKIREARLRRMARRQGLTLARNRFRDPLALGYGRYQVKAADGTQAAGFASHAGHGLTLDEVEKLLADPGRAGQ
jgi:hypothetical protein